MLADLTDLDLVRFAASAPECDCGCHDVAGWPCHKCQEAGCDVMQKLVRAYEPYA